MKRLIVLLLLAILPFALIELYTQKNRFNYDEFIHIRKRLKQLEKRVYAMREEQHSIMSKTIVPSVTVTAYAPVKEQCDNTPHITASLKHVREGICALSMDIEQDYQPRFGDKILVYSEGEVYGVFDFHDRMNPKWTRRIDILKMNVSDSKRFTPFKAKLLIIRGGVFVRQH